MFTHNKKYVAQRTLAEKRTFLRCSSSIINFHNKLLKRFQLVDWDWKDRDVRVIFFGLYHVGDYIRFIWHRGKKKVFWCGGDIVNLETNLFPWHEIIKRLECQHYCENEIEQVKLKQFGINAKVLPMIFDDPDRIIPHFEQRIVPHVYVCSHPEYNEQYGVNLIEGIAAAIPDIIFHIYGVSGLTRANIRYHGNIPSWQFDKEIRQYQAGLRLNDFDGFSEVLAKSILLGQWPISRIAYPYIDYASDITSLVSLLKSLKNKHTLNKKGREYWYKQLCQNKNILLSDWAR